MEKTFKFDSLGLNDLYNYYVREINQRNTSSGEKDNDDKGFVTISFSSKQVISTFTSRQNDTEYSRILAPDNYTFVRRTDKIKPSIKDGKLCFSVPNDYKIKLTRSVVIEPAVKDRDGNTIKKGVYKEEELVVSAEELARMYAESKEKYKQKSDELEIYLSVPAEFVGVVFSLPDKGEFRKITAPGGYSCIRPSNQVVLSDDKKTYTIKINKDYNINVGKSYVVQSEQKDANGTVTAQPEYGLKKSVMKAHEFAELFEPVEILFDEKCIVGSVDIKGAAFYRLLVKEGYTLLYPQDLVKDKGGGVKAIDTYCGCSFRLQHSTRNENVPDTASNKEKYNNEYVSVDAVKLAKIINPTQNVIR